MYTWRKAKQFDKGQTHFSSDRMLHKDYYNQSSIEKISGRGSQEAWSQDELIDRNLPVEKEIWVSWELQLKEVRSW
jgi:hypothetical protein